MAYVADYGQGLIAIDVSDPRNPTFITSWGIGKEGRDVVVVDDIVFLTEDGGRVTILQVTEIV